MDGWRVVRLICDLVEGIIPEPGEDRDFLRNLFQENSYAMIYKWHAGRDSGDADEQTIAELGESLDAYLREDLVVHSFGGEGHGDEAGVVLDLGGHLVRITAYYSSWDDTDWSESEIELVEPVQKLVTFYEPI